MGIFGNFRKSRVMGGQVDTSNPKKERAAEMGRPDSQEKIIEKTPSQSLEEAIKENSSKKVFLPFTPGKDYANDEKAQYGGVIVFDSVKEFDYIYERLRFVVDRILPHGSTYEVFLPQRFKAIGWRWSPNSPESSFIPCMTEFGGMALTFMDIVGGPKNPLGFVLTKVIEGPDRYRGQGTMALVKEKLPKTEIKAKHPRVKADI
jgi:hypothetical protein